MHTTAEQFGRVAQGELLGVERVIRKWVAPVQGELMPGGEES